MPTRTFYAVLPHADTATVHRFATLAERTAFLAANPAAYAAPRRGALVQRAQYAVNHGGAWPVVLTESDRPCVRDTEEALPRQVRLDPHLPCAILIDGVRRCGNPASVALVEQRPHPRGVVILPCCRACAAAVLAVYAEA